MFGSAQDWVAARPRLLHVADVDGDGAVDEAAVNQALAEAADELSLYLAARYPTYPDRALSALRGYAFDIATYRMASTNDALTDAIIARYETILSYLKQVAKGDVDLPGAGGGVGGSDAAAIGGAGDVQAAGPERLFTRDSMDGW